MRTQLTIAALMAASNAIDISAAQSHIDLLAQTSTELTASHGHHGDCCCQAMPCMPTCQDHCHSDSDSDDEPKQVDVEIDVTKDVLEVVKPIGDKVIKESGIKEIIETVVIKEEAEEILKEILEPIIDSTIATEVLDIAEVVEIIEAVVPEEHITTVDPLPEPVDVVKLIDEEVVPDHPEVTINEIDEDKVFTPEEIASAVVTEITNEDGDAVEVIIIKHEEPAVVEPAVEEPAVEEPTVEEPAVEEPAVEEPAVEEPAVEEPAVVEPAVVEEPAVEEPAVEEPAEEETEVKKVYGVYETTVESLEDGADAFTNLLAEVNGRPVILDFQYDSCAPCQEIAPAFEALMLKYPDAIFKKVDVMKQRDLLKELGVTSLPTFKTFVNSELVNTINGSDEFPLLDETVESAVEVWQANEDSNVSETLAQTGALHQKMASLF